jgi:hypothetical protein
MFYLTEFLLRVRDGRLRRTTHRPAISASSSSHFHGYFITLPFEILFYQE